jgi:hypothetical protein
MGLPESLYDTAEYKVEFERFLKVERWLRVVAVGM